MKLNWPKPTVFVSSVVGFLALGVFALAGSLTPPGAPGSTMNTLAELYDTIAGAFDSTGVVADQNGSLIEHLKYIEANMGTVGGGWTDDGTVVRLTTITDNVGIGTTTPGYKLEVGGGDINLASAGAGFRIEGTTVLSTTGLFNTAVGADALFTNSSSVRNTAVGYQALYSTTSGFGGNTAVGYLAMEDNTTGADNTAVGRESLGNNTTGATNVAVGQQAMYSNTTGSSNTALGATALSANSGGSANTAVGNGSLWTNSTGDSNSAIGYGSMFFNTTGTNNSVLGNEALYQNTTGANNVAVGYRGLFLNTTGFYNVALGYNAGYNALGSGNVFLGPLAGFNEHGSDTLWIANGSVASSSALIYGEFDNDYLRFNGDIEIAGTTSVSGTLFANGGCVGCGGVGSDSLDFDEFVDNMTLDADTTVANDGFALTFENASVSGDFEVAGHGSIGNAPGGVSPRQFVTLDLGENITDALGADFYVGLSNRMTINPASLTGNQVIGIYDELDTESGGSQDFDYLSAAELFISHEGTGNAEYAYGFNAGVSVFNGGTIASATAGLFEIGAGIGSTIDNGYSVYIRDALSSSGTVTNRYGLYVGDQSTGISTSNFNIFSAGGASANRFEGRMAIGNEAFIGDLFGGIPGQTLMSLHEEFIDLATFGITAGTAHTYDLNPTGTATDIIFGEDVFVRTIDTNTEDFTGGIVAGRYYPIHLGSGTVSQMDGLQIQPQTDNGTVTQMRGILVSNNTTGTGDVGDAYAIYIDGPLGVGGITNNYGLFVEDQSGSSGDSFNIYSDGVGSLNYFAGFVGVATDSPQETLSVEGTTRLDGHTGAGNTGGIDSGYYNSTIGYTNSSVIAVNEEVTSPTADVMNGISSDLIVDLAADNGLTSFIGAGNYSTIPVGNTADVFQLVGGFNSALTYGDGDTNSIAGSYNLGANWGDGTTTGLYGSFNNACNCVEGGNTTNAFSVYSSVHNSATGTITNAYDFFAEAQFGGGTITNNYGIYIAPQNGLGVVNGYNIYSAGSGTRNIFEGHASVGGNFELTGFVASNLTPRTTDTFDLGTSALRWRDLYLASGSLHIGTSGDEAVVDYNVTDDYLAFKPDGSTKEFQLFDTGAASLSNTLYVTSAGNVGIGTTVPGDPLVVERNQAVETDIRVRNTNASSGSEANMVVDNGTYFGHVGIYSAGTSYGALANNQTYFYSNSPAGVALMADNASGPIKFAAGGNVEQMRISSGGNVGIGTTIPTTKLDVAGSASVSGNFEAGTSSSQVKFDKDFGFLTLLTTNSSGGGIVNSRNLESEQFDFRLVQTNGTFQVAASQSGTVLALAQNGRLGFGDTSPNAFVHLASTAADGQTLLRLEDSNSTCDFTANAGSPTCGSDIRLKKDVTELGMGALEKLAALDVVTYHWKTDNAGAPLMTGFIAQDVREQFPDLVTTSTWIDGKPALFLSQNGFTPYLVKAIQELDLKVDALAAAGPMDFNSDTWFAGLFDRIVAKFDSMLGIVFEQGGRIRATELCLDDVCVTKEQLRELLGEQGTPTPTPSPEPQDDPSDEEEPEPYVTPEASDTPEPEPTPPGEEPETINGSSDEPFTPDEPSGDDPSSEEETAPEPESDDSGL